MNTSEWAKHTGKRWSHYERGYPVSRESLFIQQRVRRADQDKAQGGRPTPQRLATIKEACAYGKMAKTKLYEMLRAGEITGFRRGAQTLIDLDSIDAMNARKLQPWRSKG